MKKLFAVALLVSLVAVSAEAGAVRFAGRQSKRAVKASYHGAKSALKYSGKKIY